ncbi:MAG: SDR family oxidoreductase [Thalassobaculaceae bacterium]|nr:SDR family oxidoreductase [Thalassobaculaceae bacterium]
MAADRVALVTAGAQGIGRAVVLALSASDWRVAALDIDAEALAELPESVLGVVGDVGDEAVVAEAIARTVERFGRLDAIVNNAGINANGPVESLDLDAVRRVFDVSLVGILATAKHGVAHLRAAGATGKTGGAIVNIASSRALMSEPDTEAYSAAKGGVIAVTHALAMSLGTREDRDSPAIRVNAISPGWIETGPWQKVSGRRDATHSDADRQQHPVGRVGTPQDIAEAVLYLLDDRAGFITGQNLVIDGGMTKKMIYAE